MNLIERRLALLTPRQLDGCAKLVHMRGGIIWWKVGAGKSRIGLFFFASLQVAYQWSYPNICLIVCRRKAFLDWCEEIWKCFGADNVCIWQDSAPVQPPGHDKMHFLLVSHAEVEKRFASLQIPAIRVVILDESWMYANHKSKRSKTIYRLTQSRHTIGLSGTVMKASDTLEIYSQLMAVQKHRILAANPTKFRSEYQICQLQQFGAGGPQIPMWRDKPGAYKKILEKIKDVSDIYFPSDNTRVVHEQYHNVECTPQQYRAFKELREYYSLDEFNLEYNNALTISLKIQQISNGWIEEKDDKGHVIASYRIPTNKIEKLRDELEQILSTGERVLVLCAFRRDVEILMQELPFAMVQMTGGESFDVDIWRASAKVCIATEASASSVNHFDQVPYAIYFSANHKWVDMQQSRGRIDRFSSQHTECYYKYLQVVGGLDAHVYRTALRSGQDESNLIFQAGVMEWLQARKQG